MYNRTHCAEILGDLRDEFKLKYGKKPTFKELSKNIKEKTGVYISDTSLCDYENIDKEKDMSVKNMVALADYYGVSYDYLLGNSSSRERENININKKYGLSDRALFTIEVMNNTPKKEFEMSLIDALNSLLESDEFGWLIDTLAKCSYSKEIMEKGLASNENAMKEVRSTLTEEQIRLCKEGKMILVQPMNYYDVLVSTLQKTIVDIANGISEN
ncbi:hypothetical protein EDC18_10524 [Natranaerovirga pectinivora]|uniref:HTH cro/C1-type domain-containing protein n=1 Tax=Natranaerovirga pectinivora TaxID=682400 RepID=A0A4V2V081_9FIRM|nr:hypothetical protein [Natranaerovirga pectinivora]TCT14543.1 hypothetical protein EDC18_10524 [Natranaerovirga pectinivora]